MPQSSLKTFFRQQKRLAVYSRQNRSRETAAEARLWDRLKEEQFGVRFVRQYPIQNRFLADFACVGLKLVIEVDGGYHDALDQMVRDCARDAHMERYGWRVLRFTNAEIADDIQSVEGTIRRTLKQLAPDYLVPSFRLSRKQQRLLDHYHRRRS